MQTKHESDKTKSQKQNIHKKKSIGKSNKEKHIAMKKVRTSILFTKGQQKEKAWKKCNSYGKRLRHTRSDKSVYNCSRYDTNYK